MQDMKPFKDTKEVPHQNADWDIFKCNFCLCTLASKLVYQARLSLTFLEGERGSSLIDYSMMPSVGYMGVMHAFSLVLVSFCFWK